ncbi:unnamed protein product, partial [Mesorhabditis spiculigera]
MLHTLEHLLYNMDVYGANTHIRDQSAMDDANGRVPDHSAADMELDKNTGPVEMHNIQPEDRDVQQAPQGEEIQQNAEIEKPRQLEGNQRAKKRARKAKKVVQHTPFLLEVKTEAEEPSECIEGGAQLQQVHPPTQDVPVCAIARSARNIGVGWS